MSEEVFYSAELEGSENNLDDYLTIKPLGEDVDVLAYLDECARKAGLKPIGKNKDKYIDKSTDTPEVQQEVKQVETKSETPAQEQKVVKKSTQASSRSKRTATESKRDTGVTVVTSEEVGSALKIIAAIHGKTLSTFLNDFIEASFADEIKIVAKLKKLKT